MRKLTLSLCVAIFSLPAVAEESNWGFAAAVTYGPRNIDGVIFIDRPGPTVGGATADSLGLGTSDSFLYAVGFRYKRWNFTLNSMPTAFDGEGFATVGIDFGNGQVITFDTPITSTIDVNLDLVNVMYDIYKGDYGKFSIGIGLGRTTIDVALIPTLGQPIQFDGNTPFGFLAAKYDKRFGRFSLTAAAQGISIAIDSSSMKYSNLNLMGGYMFYQDKWYGEVVIGYRHVGFDFHLDYDGRISNTDMTLDGPYVGLIGGF